MQNDYKKFLRTLLGEKQLSINQKLNEIKKNVHPNDYREALKMHPSFNIALREGLYFKSPESIKQRESFQFTGDFKREFKWVTLRLEENLESIENFIKLKNQFEALILLSKFESAQELLKSIEDHFGVSLWSIEANLLIEELLRGTESNWTKLTQYLKVIDNAFYEFVISSNSKRVEVKLSHDAFTNQFQNDIDNTHASSVVRDFFVFKNYSIAKYDYSTEDLSSVIYISNIFGIIDQYLTLVDVITYLVSDQSFTQNIFLSFITKAKETVVSDNRVANIFDLISSSSVQNIRGLDLVQCHNYYYKGQFEEAKQLAKTNLSAFPSEFEFCEVYCKSVVNLEQATDVQGNTLIGSIVNEIVELLKFNSNYNDRLKKLLKHSLVLMNFSFGKQLYAFLSETEDLVNRDYNIGGISASYISIKLLYSRRIPFPLGKKFEILFTEYSYMLSAFKSGADIHLTMPLSSLKSQNDTFLAIHSFNNGNFIETISILKNSLSINSINYYLEKKLALLFKSYIEIGKLKEALDIFSEVYFSTTVYSQKLNYDKLYQALKSIDSRAGIVSINVSILFSLLVKEYDLFEVYDEFMTSKGWYSAEDINTDVLKMEYSADQVIFFLQEVATIDTLKYSTEYNSIGDVEEARIGILNRLIDLDIENKLAYETEINEIYRINSVRKVLKEVDQGRLYIDVNGLKNIQTKSFNDDYKRLKEIESLSSTQNLIGFNASAIKNWDPDVVGEEKQNLFNGADYLAFKNIYLELRDNFLFSKEYGLDSCLSTRIRHGALKNHIRSVFEKLDLVTPKSKSEYLDNVVWSAQLSSFSDLNSVVQEKLKIFSEEIDRYTAYIVENLIQIRTEKSTDKPDGLFRYYTRDELLYTFYTTNKERFDSVQTTIDILITDLVNYTLFNVCQDVVDAFTKDISKHFQSIIEKLIFELRDLSLPYNCELLSNLIKSTTEIQKELEYLSEWFYLNTTSPSTLLSIETILNASLNLTNRINPLFNLSPTINVKNDAAGFSSLIFVFNILLTNVIKHSNLENDQINLTIDVESSPDEQYIVITFKHNINPAYDYTANWKKLEQVKLNWNNNENIDRSNKEGESGYDKIKRILLYEALSKSDRFEYSIQDHIISISLYLPYSKPKASE